MLLHRAQGVNTTSYCSTQPKLAKGILNHFMIHNTQPSPVHFTAKLHIMQVIYFTSLIPTQPIPFHGTAICQTPHTLSKLLLPSRHNHITNLINTNNTTSHCYAQLCLSHDSWESSFVDSLASFLWCFVTS